MLTILLAAVSCSNPVEVSEEVRQLHAPPEDAEQTNEKLLEDNGEEVVTSEVTYYKDVKGLFTKPAKDGNYPGVVMIHEWWGLNDNIKNMAKKLAQEGYNVLAVDLYNGVVATEAEDAMAAMKAVDQQEANENMKAAVAYLKQQGVTKLGSMGWCFGGKQSLQVSLATPLDATVIYYGHLESDEDKLKSLQGPVLGIFAEKDKSIPPSAVNEFKSALDNISHQNDITIYPNVDHAFANPSGARYAPEETKDAWKKTVEFLKENLQ